MNLFPNKWSRNKIFCAGVVIGGLLAECLFVLLYTTSNL